MASIPLIISATILTCLLVVSLSSAITVDQVVVHENEYVSLDCDFGSQNSSTRAGYSIRWLRNNITVLSANNLARLSLDIPKASRYDAGLFKCELRNGTQTVTHRTKRLRVAYAPAGAPMLLPETDTGFYSVPEGQSVALKCHLVGDPGWPRSKPVWRLQKGPNNSEDCCTGQSEMVIKASSSNSSESWTCYYKNKLGSTRLASSRRFVVRPVVSVADYSYSKPTDQVAVEGETVTFTCNVSNPAVVVHWNVRYANQDTSDMNMLLTGGNGVLLRSHELSPRITSAGHLNLVIANVSRSDEAVYICKVGSNPWAEAKLTVLVRPSEPKLTRIDPENHGSNIQAGHRVTYNCSTRGGNPAPEIQWARSDGKPIGDNEARRESDTTRFGATWSSISFHVKPEDDESSIVCSIRHQLLAEPMKVVENLRVEYAPILSVAPSERLLARLGTTASIHCNAKANPPVDSLVWIRPGGPGGPEESVLTQTSEYKFQVEQSDSGTLLCRAKNSVGESEQAIGVEVLYPPELTVSNGPISVIEGRSAILRCEATASPNPTVLRWRRLGDGAILAEVSDSSALVHAVEPVSRIDAGKYVCEAHNVMKYQSQSEEGQDSKQVEIDVMYPPGEAVITNGNVVTAAAGDSVRLFCQVDDLGNPGGTVSWYRIPDPTKSVPSIEARTAVGRSSGNTAELRMEKVSAERVAGLYECIAENKFGRGKPAVVSLVVNEQPRWIKPLIPSQKPLWKAQSYSLSCSAAGNPAPTLTWQRNGHLFTDGKANGVNTIEIPELYEIVTSLPIMKNGLYNVESILRFPKAGLNRNDSGLYSCQAENKLGVSSSQTTVTVLYPPVPITSYSKFSANVGRTARLRFLVYSASQPRFYWSKGGDHISNSTPGHYIFEKGSMSHEVFESILVINHVSPKTFGNYVIRAENDQGRTVDVSLRLVEPGVPDAPRILEAAPNSWDSARLAWRAGFDGGSPQSIEILIYEVDRGLQTAERLPFKSLTVQAKSMSNQFGRSTISEPEVLTSQVNVSGLLPGQSYEVKMRGINKYGEGEFATSAFRFATPNLTEPSEVYFNPLANALKFKPADPRLCVRVAKTVDSGRTWVWLDECKKASRGLVHLKSWPVGAVAIAVQLCLVNRAHTCTGLVSAQVKHFDPSENRDWSPFASLNDEGAVVSGAFLSTPALILAVAAGVGATLILLLVSVVVVCNRRRKGAIARNHNIDYNVYNGRGSGSGTSDSSDSTEDTSSKPVLLSAGSGGCYAAIDTVVSTQHSGSTSGVSGSSPLDMSELLSHQSYHHSSAAMAAFTSLPHQSFLPHPPHHLQPQLKGQHFPNGWSHSSTTSGSTESAMLPPPQHHVDDSGIAGQNGEDLTAMLRRICSTTNQAESNAAPLLSTYNQQQLSACQTPDPNGQQRRVRYEVVV